MAITKTFLDAVNNNSINEVRIMMKDSLLNDTSFSEFGEMERRASGMVGLYVDYDGRPLISDSNQWTTDYLDLIMVQLISNFCHERIEHIKKVVKYLYPATTASNFTNSSSANNTQRTNTAGTNSNYGRTSSKNNSRRRDTYTYRELKRRDTENGRIKMVRIGIGAGVGAIVGGIVASEVLPGVIVGGAIGALGACFINRKLENER